MFILYKLMKFLWLLLMILFCSQKGLKQVKHIHELLSTIFALILQHYFLLLGFLFYNRMKCLFGTESNLLRLDRKPSSEKTAQYKLISFRITPWSKIVHNIQHHRIYKQIAVSKNPVEYLILQLVLIYSDSDFSRAKCVCLCRGARYITDFDR